MDFERVFRMIDEKTEEYVGVWQDVANIESPTACKAGVDAVGTYFAEKAAGKGWKTEFCPQKISGDAVCTTMNEGATGAPVALSGHMDTVHAVGSFGTPAVRIEDDKIYGPGVTDCKGGLVAAMLAMDALAACDFDTRPVLLLLQSDEETGSKGSEKGTIRWICEKAKDCVAFLNTEAEKKNSVVLMRKGILRYRFCVKGEAIHSASCADGKGGINAIVEAAHKILALEKYKDADGITVNCGLIEGGTTANTVPEACTFVADIRFANDGQMAEVERIVREVADHAYLTGSTCVLEKISYRVAMQPEERNFKLLEKANEAFARAGLPQRSATLSKGGSDAADVSAYGVPTLDSLGVRGGLYHTLGEYGEIASLAETAKRLAAIVMSI